MGQDPAAKKASQLRLDKRGEAGVGWVLADAMYEGLEVLAQDLMQHGLLGAPALVRRWKDRRAGHRGPAGPQDLGQHGDLRAEREAATAGLTI
jgi:hypothetical protein